MTQGGGKTLIFSLWLGGLVILSFLIVFFSPFLGLKTAFVLVGSLAFTPLLIALLTRCFGRIRNKNGIWDFVVGDNGTYSLSRVQGVLWATIVIAFQFETIVALIINPKGGFRLYEPILSESTIWLLGLSLTSYLAVKSITVTNLEKQPERYKRKSKPSWTDLMMGPSGLDFSRCQMLIWTLIAVAVFLSKCYFYIHYLMIEADGNNIKLLLNHIQDEYAAKSADDPIKDLPFVPFLPWSFIVLMGLSQGAYVGKKLVPTFKLNDLQQIKENDLQSSIQQLNIKKKLLSNIQSRFVSAALTPIEKQSMDAIQRDIDSIELKIQSIKKDISDINNYKN